MIFKVALRNLGRNRRRSLLNVSLIALGSCALLLLQGYMQATYAGIRDNYIQEGGHFYAAPQGREVIPAQALRKLQELLQGDPKVTRTARVLHFRGLIGNAESSTPFWGLGVEPHRPIPDWKVVEGRRFRPEEREAAVISRDLARQLKVTPGDPLVLLTFTVDGVYNASNLRVVGIFDAPNIRGNVVVVPLPFAQQLLNTQGVSRLIVFVRREREAREVLERLQTQPGFPEGVKLVYWEEAADFYRQVRAFLGTLFGFVGVLVFLLVGASILESLTMSFFERVREIGVLRALGTQGRQVFVLFLVEGGLTGLLGGLVGLGLGAGIGVGINALELTYLPPMASGPMPFRIALGGTSLVWPLLVPLLASWVSALFPAWRAFRLQPVDALRYV